MPIDGAIDLNAEKEYIFPLTERGMPAGSRTIIRPMRWRRLRRLGGGIGMRRKILGRMRWVKVAQKEREKVRQGVGIVEIHHTSKGIVRKEKEKDIEKEEEAKDTPKEEVKDSKEAKDNQEGVGNKEKEKDS